MFFLIRTSNFDGSDSDEQRGGKRRPNPRSQPIFKGRKANVMPNSNDKSSGESDREDFVSHLKAGNFADLVNDSVYLPEKETQNIRVVSRQRPSTLLRPTNNTVKPAGSFVPREVRSSQDRDWRPKNSRISTNEPYEENESGRSQGRRSVPVRQSHEETHDRAPGPWTRAPKKFLEEPEDIQDSRNQMNSDDRYKTSRNIKPVGRDWNKAKSNRDEYNDFDDTHQRNKTSASTGRRQNFDDEDEIVSHESADTIEEDRNRRKEKKFDNEASSMRQPVVHEFNPNRKPMKAEEFEVEEEEEDIVPPPKKSQGILKGNNNNNVKNTKNNNLNNNRLKDVFQRSNEEEEEEAFIAFANQKEKEGIILPRKSGRYDEPSIDTQKQQQHQHLSSSRDYYRSQQTARDSRDQFHALEDVNSRDEEEEEENRRYQTKSSSATGNKYNQRNNEDEEGIETFELRENTNNQYRNPPASHNQTVLGNSKKPNPIVHRERSNSGGGGWFSSFTGSGKNKSKDNDSDKHQKPSSSWNVSGGGVAASTSSTVNNFPSNGSSSLTAAYNAMTGKNSFVLISHPHGIRSRLVQCTIVRDRNSIHGKLYPTYELILEEPRKTLIIARKMSMNRTSNYHLFDMTRGAVSQHLSKKAGNYLGKLRAKNMNRTGYSLVTAKEDAIGDAQREEIAGILFDRITFIDQIQDGNQPRKMKILLPLLNEDSIPIPLITSQIYGLESLPDMLQLIDENKLTIPNDLRLLHTKEPVFENGNYRLNFHGRVSLPSVKNFQMVSPDDISDIKCQFGKVEKDIFHLDYKEPFNAVQAFALALCQFNL